MNKNSCGYIHIRISFKKRREEEEEEKKGLIKRSFRPLFPSILIFHGNLVARLHVET